MPSSHADEVPQDAFARAAPLVHVVVLNYQETLREAFPHHCVVQSGRNRGYAAGDNVGLRIALEEGADFALILNNDTWIIVLSAGTLMTPWLLRGAAALWRSPSRSVRRV